jgi:hypothetical protein
VSALSFGAMRLPPDDAEAVRIMRRAIDLGVNYLDTAPGYSEGRSERLLGEAVKPYDRSSLTLSTKNPIRDASGEGFRQRLENSLKEMGLDYIDVYHMWGIRWETYENVITQPGGPLEAARQAKEEGLIRHLAFSFHGAPEDLARLAETGNYESCTVQYNVLDRRNEPGIARAHELGMGVVIMGPVGGGRLAEPSPAIQALIPGGAKSSAEVALRFVLANPNVSCAISGMSAMEQVEENIATASRAEPMGDDERRRVAEMLEENQRLADLYCTGCDYCKPCEQGVDIGANFRLMNYMRIYGLEDHARREYARLSEQGKGADACSRCGECEPKCPQSISIMDQLEEVAAALGGEKRETSPP